MTAGPIAPTITMTAGSYTTNRDTIEGLVYEVGGIKQVAQWPCVTEVFSSHGYWIFMAQGSFFIVPERCFASKDKERGFITAAMLFLNDEAKARSPDARAVLDGGLR